VAILIVVEDEPLARKLSGRRFEIIADFKKNIGDRRIDLSILFKGAISTEPFWIATFPPAHQLHQWS
jgi:hypothetical protein